MRMLKLSPTLALLTVFAACTSGPALDSYPRREIDRPLTLPAGVATWHIPTVAGLVKDHDRSTGIPPITVPLIWESAIADDWTLIWAPIPLGVVHQLWNNDDSRAGLSLTFAMAYGSERGFAWSPAASFAYRHKFDETLALDVIPSATITFEGDEGQDHWSIGVASGPLFQISDTFAFSTKIIAGASKGGLKISSTGLEGIKRTNEEAFSFGLSVDGTWSFARQWDLRPLYSFSMIGGSQNQLHLAVIDFVHFW
ncbi:MAG TPA: hypothetical protein VM901_10745 [Bdellovibrionota bacterium]|nr:hypothetical protein [Bdellovibrionota bacterium]